MWLYQPGITSILFINKFLVILWSLDQGNGLHEDLDFFFFFLGLHPRHMEVPRLGVKSELQLSAYATATAMQYPSHICDLHHSSRRYWILNPMSKARDQTLILMDTSQIHFHCTTTGTPKTWIFYFCTYPLHGGFPGLGMKPENPHHSSDKAGSLTHWATTEHQDLDFLKNFYWSIVDLHYFVKSQVSTKWVIYIYKNIYKHIHSFSDPFPM